MPNEKLAAFVAASKLKGASDDFLAALLMRHGWPRDDVFGAIAAYWEGATGLCVPERAENGESARDGFLYLLAFLTLAIWSSALGSMLFQFIDHWFPDPVAVTWHNLRLSVTWQMASVAVAFPIFAMIMRMTLSEATQSPERLESGVRRWLTYIALFLTASGVLCDLIVFLNSFLQGGLTTRFVLKVLTILVICGATFVYYLSSLRWGRNSEFCVAKKQSLVFGLSSLVVIAVAFCTGLSLAGTPSIQRHLEADKRRIDDLQQLASSVYSWRRQSMSRAQSKGMPLLLTDAVGGDNSRTLDPETKRPYRYVPVGGTRYQLCAAFAGSNGDEIPTPLFWRHEARQTCFTFDAQRLPPWP